MPFSFPRFPHEMMSKVTSDERGEKGFGSLRRLKVMQNGSQRVKRSDESGQQIREGDTASQYRARAALRCLDCSEGQDSSGALSFKGAPSSWSSFPQPLSVS